ncbi:MAG: 50S ribosomal protein L13 [bacterium]
MERQKTTFMNNATADRGWVLIDVENQVVGRAASQIADILRGKHRPTYTPNTDAGDFVVVINASKLRFTGNKLLDKEYFHHTGYFGGIKSITAEKQLAKHPDRVLRDAVWGMLPKNTLSRSLIKKLKIYADSEHPHTAQNPVAVKIEGNL